MSDPSFACLAMLEDEAYQLYEMMVHLADDNQTSLLLDIILQETRKHRELLRHLSRVFEHSPPQSTIECERLMGQLFTQAVMLVRSVKNNVLNGATVREAARELADFERGASEEYVAEMHAGIRAIVQTNPAVKKILEGIANDEKGHIEILQLVTNIAANK